MKLNLCDQNGESYGHYEGDVRDGNILTGAGTIFYNDGSRFDGFFLEGEEHGYGERFKNGELLYRGEWFNGEVHGCGYRKYTDATYVGYLVNGRPHGFGVYFFNDGVIYVGEHKQGKLHGKGTYLYADGKSRLEGWWAEGEKLGAFFDITEDSILKSIYTDGARHEVGYVSHEDRLLNDPSGIYGRVEKNGKTYFGKYLSIESDTGYDVFLCGMALAYESADSWDVSAYENDVLQGESVSFSDDGFERCFFVDGKPEGLYIKYDTGEVTCQLPTGQYDDTGTGFELDYGVKYDFGDLYFGYFCAQVPHGSGLFYSSEDKMLRAVEMSFNEEIHGENLLRTDDVFGFCSSLSRATYPGLAMDANRDHFAAGEVLYSFSTGEKTLKPEGCLSFNRTTKEFNFTLRDGSRGYSSTSSGGRRYFVKDKLTWLVSDAGDYRVLQIKEDHKTLIKKNRDYLHTASYNLDCDLGNDLNRDPDTEPLYELLELNSGLSMYYEKEHTSDSIVWSSMAYYGHTENREPCGYGQLVFPGFGYAMGRWRGRFDCDDATFFTYETQKNDIVTIADGTITFPDGNAITFWKK